MKIDPATLRQAKELLDENPEDLYEHAPCGYMSIYPDGLIAKVNQTFLNWTGYQRSQLVDKLHFQQLLSVGGKIFFETHFAPQLQIQGTVNEIAMDICCAQGGTLPVLVNGVAKRDAEGRIVLIRASITNISERRRYERELLKAMRRAEHIAHHDALTQLPNRVLLQDRLDNAIRMALRHHGRCALLFIDLDRFKQVNDTLGHLTGDQLLIETARRLQSCVRDSDTVSRQGGDEFIILLPEVTDSSSVIQVARHLLRELAKPFHINGHEIHVSGSIGISLYPDDGSDVPTLMKHADTAMYHAKSLGRNNYQFFAAHINERALRRSRIEHAIRNAMASGKAMLHYQPKVDVHSGQVIGAEALLRLAPDEDTLHLPSHFIPIAEESGLVIELGRWALEKACCQNREWQQAGYSIVPISVNVTAAQFKDKSFVAMVADILDRTGLEARYLELELTESTAMQDSEFSTATFNALKSMGIGLSIDDFGTGHSSLSYLKRFPIDTLKIDQSFVRDVPHDSDSAAITCAIIDMARNLKQNVIAEGVETAEQLKFLRDHGCRWMQGYYFGKPVPARVFAERLLRTPS